MGKKLILTAALLAAACSGQPEQITAAQPVDNVVLIVVDTLRADRLGCYGYTEQPTTPAIDALASEGILFETFHASSPWTAPSFASMLTGVAPTVHRTGKWLKGQELRDAEEILPFGAVRMQPIRTEIPLLTELADNVRSAAFVTNTFLDARLGFGRGFDHYDCVKGGLNDTRRADEITTAAIEWLEANHDQPFFILLHYFDPHMSYDPPPAYRERFAPGKVGRVDVPFTDLKNARSGEFKPTPEERSFIDGLYNGEVRFVDDQIALFVEAMRERGLLGKSWIVVTSDHGEELFDHGSFEHGHRYEEEVTRVPLVIRAPGGLMGAGSSVTAAASHVDLMPTTLEWLGVAVPDHVMGRSLTPMITGEETKSRPAYMEFNLFWKPQRSLFDGRFKLIQFEDGSGGYMYDLAEDPKELNMLGPDHPQYAILEDQIAAVRQQLAAQVSLLKGEDEPIILPEEMEESLRSLGYIR
jgi:arylsulfatase A-like enzyme